jgi:hypothetical protein
MAANARTWWAPREKPNTDIAIDFEIDQVGETIPKRNILSLG